MKEAAVTSLNNPLKITNILKHFIWEYILFQLWAGFGVEAGFYTRKANKWANRTNNKMHLIESLIVDTK